MPGVVRSGDRCSGHGCWGSRSNVQASGNVYINGKGAHRLGDGWAIHCCPDLGCHSGSAASASSNVFVNGKGLARIGDSVSCGSRMMQGSSNVFCNG